MLIKILTLGASSLMGLVLMGFYPPPPADAGPPPPPKEKGKEKAKGKREPGPGDDLRRAYELLRRLRADGHSAGRPEERLRDWTERATRLYRDGVRAAEAGDGRLAHEYGAASHDLARAIDHARRAAQFDRPDPELPAPPSGPGPERDGGPMHHDLRRAYDRTRALLDDGTGPDAKFYTEAARDLYNAARRDAEAGRLERAAELARAAEAMTHVPEHLAHAAGTGRDEPPGPGSDFLASGRRGPDTKERPRPEPGRPGEAVPPPLN